MIEIERFIKQYKNESITLQNLVFKHGITLLRGGNGSGKSTLLKALAGLISSNITPLNVGYMSERPTFPPYMSGLKYLESVQAMSPNPHQSPRRLLEQFGLSPYQHNRVKTYSKGMRQKLAFCELLMEKKTIYLLDEPFNGLDSQSLETTIQIVENLDAIVIIALHEPVQLSVPYEEVRICKASS